MRWLAILVVAGGLLSIALTQRAGEDVMHKQAAQTYENLANAIIAVRETENALVLGILWHSHALAGENLASARDGTSRGRVAHLEAAAREITNIANEGDSRVQAVRQRLLKAGHHHNTDTETQEDYIFIDSEEKARMLELATQISRLGPKATPEAIDEVSATLTKAFMAATKPE